MIPQDDFAFMQGILAVSNFLAVERPFLPEATRQILQAAHAEVATCIFDSELGSFQAFLSLVQVPFEFSNKFIKLSIGQWLDFFNPDGSPSPTMGDFLKAAGLSPLTQTLPNPPSPSPPSASLQSFFGSQEQYQAFQQILPCCHTAKQGHHCLHVATAGGPFLPSALGTPSSSHRRRPFTGRRHHSLPSDVLSDSSANGGTIRGSPPHT